MTKDKLSKLVALSVLLLYTPQALALEVVPTYDTKLAERQVAIDPEGCEAAFILAVALTRTDRMEEALREMKRARKLAENEGGAAIFDRMISAYEGSLTAQLDTNEAFYGLAWAYYEKACSLARAYFNNEPSRTLRVNLAVPKQIEKALRQHEFRHYYDLSVKSFDEVLQRTPDDVYAAVYRTHVKAEYTHNFEEAATTLRAIQLKHPDSPLPSLFLEELELRKQIQKKYGPKDLISTSV